VNFMAGNLTGQVRNITGLATSVTNSDVTRMMSFLVPLHLAIEH
jgi:hypothetical protein